MQERRVFIVTSLALSFASAFLAIWASVSMRKDEGLSSRRQLIDRVVDLGRPFLPDVAVSNASSVCVPFDNSQAWLQGTRLVNLGASDGLDHNFAKNSILSLEPGWNKEIKPLMSQSLCHETSRFTNFLSPGYTESNDEDAVHRAATALSYLALHRHQHIPAIPEAKQRYPSNSSAGCLPPDVGTFDYECPDAKFLVVRYRNIGVGANLRLAAVPAFTAGLASNRVVLFVNNLDSEVNELLSRRWASASCDRHDSQCFFLPSSPCVLTKEELENATTLVKAETRDFFKKGKVPNELSNHRVLILNLSMQPRRRPPNTVHVVHRLAQQVLEAGTVGLQDFSPFSDLMKRAMDRLLQEDKPSNDTQGYYGVNSPIFHGLLLYATRPNMRSSVSMDIILRDMFSDIQALDNSVGLPIRASDKCRAESECMPFEQYVRAVEDVWNHVHRDASSSIGPLKYSANPIPVVVTTESNLVREQLDEYVQMMKSDNHTLSSKFPARFITNDHDVMQGTGSVGKHFHKFTTTTADEIMVSAFSSLKAQLATAITVGNCCSNFHLLLKDLLHAGCGTQENNIFQCLQDNPNPEHRLCCMWDKSERCVARRSEIQLENK